MDDPQILEFITMLVDEEHRIENAERGESRELTPDEHIRLQQIEVALDQCWDLLRQRRARRLAGEDPDQAMMRPPSMVETYEQ
jgi:hypothetical protein